LTVDGNYFPRYTAEILPRYTLKAFNHILKLGKINIEFWDQLWKCVNQKYKGLAEKTVKI
jgi:hypothetical protein